MSRPAARMGDMTTHGGVIASGFFTVLIGGKPAARLGDMQTCPMFTALVPHVGGPITLGSLGVLIGGQMAARMGDITTCAGPPGTIAMGCPTVLIGDIGVGSAGSAGAMGTASGAAAGARASRIDTKSAIEALEQIVSEAPAGASLTWGAEYQEALLNALSEQAKNKESSTKTEHWIEFTFVDKAGLPVSRVSYEFTDTESKESHGLLPGNGTIARDGIPAGQGKVILMTVYNAQWSKEMVRVGEAVTMSADVDGFDPDTPAVFRIYKRDVQGPDILMDTVITKTQADRVEADWMFTLPAGEKEIDVPEEGAPDKDVEDQRYSAPVYYFDVMVELCMARSGLLYVEDFIEVEVCDEEDNPVPDQEYVLYACTGEVRQDTLDASGQTREDKIPSGLCNLRFPTLPDVEFEGPETDGSTG